MKRLMGAFACTLALAFMSSTSFANEPVTSHETSGMSSETGNSDRAPASSKKKHGKKNKKKKKGSKKSRKERMKKHKRTSHAPAKSANDMGAEPKTDSMSIDPVDGGGSAELPDAKDKL